MKVRLISVDNPYFLPFAFLLFGLIGFLFYKFASNAFVKFDILFVFLSFVLLVVLYRISLRLDGRRLFQYRPMNPIFALIVVVIKLFMLVQLISVGVVESFDDRLAAKGSSFLLGFDVALTPLLFPIIPLLARSFFIRRLAIVVWAATFIASAILAPSKSILISVFFSVLVFYFFTRKNIYGKRSRPLVSVGWYFVPIFIMIATLLFIYMRQGDSAIYILANRVAMNFDSAIYAGMVAESSPPHGILFYGFLPVLKQFDPSLRELEYFSISQWLLSEAMGISRYGRYGYPNDNLIVGLLVSYQWFGVVLFVAFVIAINIIIKKLLKRRYIGVVEMYFILLFPTLFASYQDFMIKAYVFVFLFLGAFFVYLFIPKRSKYVPIHRY